MNQGSLFHRNSSQSIKDLLCQSPEESLRTDKLRTQVKLATYNPSLHKDAVSPEQTINR